MESICIVCHEKLNSTAIILASECGHIFHDNCINRWLKECKHPSCPVCRHKMDTQNLRKLYLDSSSIPENKMEKSLDELKNKLNEKIKELQKSNLELDESRKEKIPLHETINDLSATIYTLKMEAKDVEEYEAENKNLMQQNENLQNEQKRLSNIKAMMEASAEDADKLFKDIQTLPLSDKEKVSEIAIVCSISKRELSRSEEEKAHLQNVLSHSEEEKAHLQNELTKVKQRVEELENKYKNLPFLNSMDHICASSRKQFREAKKEKVQEKKDISNELNHLSNIKVMKTGNSVHVDKVFRSIQALPLSDKEKVAKIAIIGSLSKNELFHLKREKAQLQNQLKNDGRLQFQKSMSCMCVSCKQAQEAREKVKQDVQNNLISMSKVKYVLEGSSDNLAKFFRGILELSLSDKEKMAKMATGCSISKMELSFSELKEAQLQNKLKKGKQRVKEPEARPLKLQFRKSKNCMCDSLYKQARSRSPTTPDHLIKRRKFD